MRCFLSTQRNAPPAVLTVMVGPVLWGTLNTVLSSRRPCRCRREETSLWRRRTSERRPFFHQSNQHYWWVMKTPATDSLTSHRHERQKNMRRVHYCMDVYACMVYNVCSVCNAIKINKLHHLFYKRYSHMIAHDIWWRSCGFKWFTNTESQRS